MTGIPFFLCFPAWQTLRSWAFGTVTWNFNMKPCHRKRLMLSLNPNGITKNSPTIESIGRKAENWIKSIVVVLYCVDKTARYLLQSQKNSIVCCCTAFRKHCKSKEAFLRGALWAENPSFLRFSRRKTAAIRTVEELEERDWCLLNFKEFFL